MLAYAVLSVQIPKNYDPIVPLFTRFQNNINLLFELLEAFPSTVYYDKINVYIYLY